MPEAVPSREFALDSNFGLSLQAGLSTGLTDGEADEQTGYREQQNGIRVRRLFDLKPQARARKNVGGRQTSPDGRDKSRAEASEPGREDDHGRQRNPHLLDYKLVTASDAPSIEIAWIETDTPNAGPKGSKGVGEPPCVPTAGAIGNAIAKVLGERVRALPMTPERVWEAQQK